MAKAIEAYVDERGKLHRDPHDAIVADLAAALGRVGDQTGMAEGVARVILARRLEIERAFKDLDELDGEGSLGDADADLSRVIRMNDPR